MRQCGPQYPTKADAKAAAARRAGKSSKPGTWDAGDRCICGQFHVRYCKPAAAPKARPAAQPKPRTRIKPVSDRRARENRERRAMLQAKYPERPMCEVPWCTRWADDAHEPLTRGRGGSITDPGNVLAICRPHHDEVTFEEPEWAYELGFLVHSWPGQHADGFPGLKNSGEAA